jgi:hypothetical protein
MFKRLRLALRDLIEGMTGAVLVMALADNLDAPSKADRQLVQSAIDYLDQTRLELTNQVPYYFVRGACLMAHDDTYGNQRVDVFRRGSQERIAAIGRGDLGLYAVANWGAPAAAATA